MFRLRQDLYMPFVYIILILLSFVSSNTTPATDELTDVISSVTTEPSTNLNGEVITPTVVLPDTSASIAEAVTDLYNDLSSILPETELMSSSSSIFIDNLSTLDPVQSSSGTIMFSSAIFNESSTMPSTTTVGLNTSDILQEYWVRTVLTIRREVNISIDEFWFDMERKLLDAFQEGYQRREDIENGVYEPLLRRKRMAVSDDGEFKLQINNVSRSDDNNNVDIVYITQINGTYILAHEVVAIFDLFSDQELALRLGHVVAVKAETYIPKPVEVEDRKLWIIGAVLGPIALFLFVWLILCCIFRCCRKSPIDEAKHSSFSEPHLLGLKRSDDSQERPNLNQLPKEDYVEEPIEKSSGHPVLYKKGSYEVNPDPEELISRPQSNLSEKSKTPSKKSHSSKHDSPKLSPVKQGLPQDISDGGDTITYISEGQQTLIPKPKLRKSKRQSQEKESLRANTFDEVESITDMEEQPTTIQHEQQGEELLQMERKRNKQRLRERRKNKESQLINDGTLDKEEQRSSSDVSIQKSKKRPSKPKRSKAVGHSNEGFSDDENAEKPPETINEARKRMHQLLDDAFSLLSSSTSSIGNKVDPVVKDDVIQSKPPRPRSSHKSDKDNTEVQEVVKEDPVEEKLHTPMFVNPTYEDLVSASIETWSPYRAGDEVARISLPQTQPIKDKNPKQNKVNTTTFNENLQTSLQDNYYVAEPVKPTHVKNKDFEKKGNGHINGYINHKSPAIPNGGYPYPGIQNFDDIPITEVTKYGNIYPSFEEDNIEMDTLSNGHIGNKFKHTPHQAWQGEDELDVIKKSLSPGQPPTPLIESIRDELNHLSKRSGDQNRPYLNISTSGDIQV